ncbi:SMI1/KNR4 family protein [Bacillus sp. ISL-37]|uniref:SMI1/KNR4 family protein n=1 Tax=Bacillus sp. ISL-37 TaxID=2819123 RepID=UPI001BE6C588|nr:SMI1/KNR4 family protein [Bacillus sp. ISL-37]MBT2684532.1 SMI1/KNR4 family protein [Bacillus sp. ISL-37]
MYNEFLNKIEKLYKDDRKKLRTGTLLYGNLYEDRWQTNIQRPLNLEDLNSLELEIGNLPEDFKEFLLTANGCYLFDILRIAGKQDGYKGMTIEEQIHQPISFRNIPPYLWNRKRLDGLFVFADSMATGRFFVYNGEGQILQMDMRSFKPIDTYPNLMELLEEVFEEGERLVLNKDYLDFD